MRNAAVPNKDMFMKRDRKFVRYKEGAALYGIGITRFQQLAREAKAVYKVDGICLVNTMLFDKFLEGFREY